MALLHPTLDGYATDSGRFAGFLSIAFPSASVSGASGSSDVMDLGDRGTARLDLYVTALGAGTTFTPTITTCATPGGSFRSVAAFTGVTSASAYSAERKSFTGLDRYVQIAWTLSGGTTTATYRISGDAV